MGVTVLPIIIIYGITYGNLKVWRPRLVWTPCNMAGRLMAGLPRAGVGAVQQDA